MLLRALCARRMPERIWKRVDRSARNGRAKKDDGGAVAVWAPTGLSYNTEARVLDEVFFQKIFAADEPILGEVVIDALEAYTPREGGQPFMLDIYNLLGDPALQMK